MRVLGVILVMTGSDMTVWCVLGTFERRRPMDVACAALAPLAVLLALLGALLIFVPGFLG
jgi:hypothetical protein